MILLNNKMVKRNISNFINRLIYDTKTLLNKKKSLFSFFLFPLLAFSVSAVLLSFEHSGGWVYFSATFFPSVISYSYIRYEERGGTLMSNSRIIQDSKLTRYASHYSFYLLIFTSLTLIYCFWFLILGQVFNTFSAENSFNSTFSDQGTIYLYNLFNCPIKIWIYFVFLYSAINFLFINFMIFFIKSKKVMFNLIIVLFVLSLIFGGFLPNAGLRSFDASIDEKGFEEFLTPGIKLSTPFGIETLNSWDQDSRYMNIGGELLPYHYAVRKDFYYKPSAIPNFIYLVSTFIFPWSFINNLFDLEVSSRIAMYTRTYSDPVGIIVMDSKMFVGHFDYVFKTSVSDLSKKLMMGIIIIPWIWCSILFFSNIFINSKRYR